MIPDQVKAILEKMKDPKYPELNFEFAFKLTNESERGAILIGASKIEDYLQKLIECVLPSSDKQYKARLFNYPGPLSSFSGKIELMYAFRIIDKKVYDSLNTLRQIRNDAAHTSELFSLQAKKEKLEKVYNFEEHFPEVIHKLAYDKMIDWKKGKAKEGLSDPKFAALDLDFEEMWKEIVPNPDEHETIQEHLTIWKLAFGLTFLCLKLEVISEEFQEKFKST